MRFWKNNSVVQQAHNDVLLSGFTREEQGLLMSLLDRVVDNLRRNLDKPDRDAGM